METEKPTEFAEANPDSPFIGNSMPDLSGLDLDLEIALAGVMLFGPPVLFTGTPAEKLVRVFLRNVTKAVRSYERARAQVDRMGEARDPELPRRAMAGIAASSELEDSVASFKRAAYAFHQLCSARNTRVSRRTAQLSEAQLGWLVEVRNAVEHCEKAIVEDSVATDDLLMISPRRHDFQMAGHTVRYVDYAGMLSRFHALGTRLVERDPELDSSA